MVYFVDGVLASGVEIILKMDFVRYAIQDVGYWLSQYKLRNDGLAEFVERESFDRPSQYPIDQSPPQEMSIQNMEVQKQQYLEEMRSMINQIQIEDYHNERIDIHYIRECEISIDMLKDNFNKMSIEIEKITKEKELRQREQAANLSTYTVEPSRRFNYIYYDDDDNEERTIPLNEFFS
ncbi:hypothetical protein Tco_0079132 [Tanacetum coccineum]